MRILIIEDDQPTAAMLVEAITRDGHEAVVAPSANSAMRVADPFSPDVILLDIGLPDLNGYELAVRFRSAPNGASLCIIAITGSDQPLHRRKSRVAGLDRHLVKPIDIDALRRILSAEAERRSTTGR